MKIEWLLPTYESKTTNDEIVSHNAKYHCFIDDNFDEGSAILHNIESLCGRHKQIVGFYEAIESKAIATNPDIACKRCYKKWLKLVGKTNI